MVLYHVNQHEGTHNIYHIKCYRALIWRLYMLRTGDGVLEAGAELILMSPPCHGP